VTEVRLLAVALLLGGLRDPRFFAVAGVAVFIEVWRKRPLLGPSAAFLPWLILALLSAAASSQPLAGLPVLARWSAVLAYASLAASWEEELRREWLKILLASAAVLALAALWTGAGRGFCNEMTGLLPPHYNYTVFVLAAASAAAGSCILHPERPGGERIAAGAVLALCLVAIFLSHSRGGALGLSAGAAFLAWRRGPRLRLTVGLALAAMLAALLVIPAARSGLFKSGRLRGEARPAIWRAAVCVAGDSPILGEGPGNFKIGFLRHPAATPSAAARWGLSSSYAHSEPLQAAAETGWIGLGLWLFGAVWFLRALARRDDFDAASGAAAAAAASMSAQLLVDNMLQIPALAALWLSALAVAGAPALSQSRWLRASAVLGGLLALLSWIPGRLAASSPQRAAAIFPADAEAYEDMAWRSEGHRDLLEAERFWLQAEARAPYNAVYPWSRARLAAASGRWGEAEALAERSIALEPGFLRARLLRAGALLRLNRPAQATSGAAEIRRRLRAAPEGPAENGYERIVSDFDAADLKTLGRLELLANKQGGVNPKAGRARRPPVVRDARP